MDLKDSPTGQVLVHEELLKELVNLLEEEQKIRRRIAVVIQRLRVNPKARPPQLTPFMSPTGIRSRCVELASQLKRKRNQTKELGRKPS